LIRLQLPALVRRMELARLGRAFTPSLPEEADEEQAVEAARRFLENSTGYLLLVDDAVDMDELWMDPAGRQAGNVYFTSGACAGGLQRATRGTAPADDAAGHDGRDAAYVAGAAQPRLSAVFRAEPRRVISS
jgi:hypothetical protein